MKSNDLPRIAIISMFRDDPADYVRRYFERIGKLDYPRDRLRFYLVEGDSEKELTLSYLQAEAVADERVTVIQFQTGIARHHHTTHPARMKTLARTVNVAIEAIIADGWATLFALQESDLLVPTDIYRRLVERRPGGGVIAPMVWIVEGGQPRFYDTWAFRALDEARFQPYSPAWYTIHQQADDVYEIFSAGSLVLAPMDLAWNGARLTEDEAVVGFCREARRHGAKVYCDPATHIIHPPLTADQLEEMWRQL